MTAYTVEITQNYRATRRIVVQVEADDIESAVENVASGAIDPPTFDHPDWRTGWDLQDESVGPAGTTDTRSRQ